ncbi:biopolymer transporter ExbD [Cellvibrio zantedeschiae]|uniref:Biopolymer transporter ExbD n=1 Tax=Cellvibrio zantedeschiae TaxID=1237077 RepID=A0ABQ3AWM8_9GAMM|nr:biopolymer transporter ExbD [Cellvibrio zantedeschiae]GGY69680.1 biopolymer transporter ExbD [Cellvibrio zantedeschiae]
MAFGSDFEDDKDMSDINMTPLVDVMLVLLIIFIIAVPVITHSVKVDLPRADNTLNDIKPETINLTVTADGKIHWNETDITEQELQSRLSAESTKQPQPEIHIRGDRKVAYEHVMKVMASVQRAGILKLGFVSEPGQ